MTIVFGKTVLIDSVYWSTWAQLRFLEWQDICCSWCSWADENKITNQWWALYSSFHLCGPLRVSAQGQNVMLLLPDNGRLFWDIIPLYFYFGRCFNINWNLIFKLTLAKLLELGTEPCLPFGKNVKMVMIYLFSNIFIIYKIIFKLMSL